MVRAKEPSPPTPTLPLRGGGRIGRGNGQALIETAITLPVLLMLLLAFLAGGVGAQAYVDVTTAVYLASASNVTAFANDRADADQFAQETFDRTIAHDSLVAPQGFGCGPAAANGGYGAGQSVTCQATATIEFSRTPLSVVIPFNPTFSASADGTRSPYRSERP
jgi:Flp pilus assembly protein TadG